MFMVLAALVIVAFQSFPQVMADSPERKPATAAASSTIGQVLASHPLSTYMAIVFMLLISSVAFMQPGMPGFGAGRNQVPQVTFGLSSLKIPPAWSAENKAYPFRKWVNDVLLWAATTDLDPEKIAPAVAMQITGIAKVRIDELLETPGGMQQLQYGGIDPNTGQQYNGLQLLMRMLSNKFGPLDHEIDSQAIRSFRNFRRLPGEGIDAYFLRFGCASQGSQPWTDDNEPLRHGSDAT